VLRRRGAARLLRNLRRLWLDESDRILETSAARLRAMAASCQASTIECTVSGHVSRQNSAVTVRRAASGSTGCRMRSITPFWHTAAGGGLGELHSTKRLSVRISEP
jgi:hypothetical protein